jgi:hypothetical protein
MVPTQEIQTFFRHLWYVNAHGCNSYQYLFYCELHTSVTFSFFLYINQIWQWSEARVKQDCTDACLRYGILDTKYGQYIYFLIEDILLRFNTHIKTIRLFCQEHNNSIWYICVLDRIN